VTFSMDGSISVWLWSLPEGRSFWLHGLLSSRSMFWGGASNFKILLGVPPCTDPSPVLQRVR